MKRYHIWYLLCFIGLGLFGWHLSNPVTLLNVLTPPRGYKIQTDLAYGRENRQNLDIYMPIRYKKTKAPVILFFYGGAWQAGDKEHYKFVGQNLASKGIIVVVANYRIYPEVCFPTFVDDGALAVKWVHENLEKYVPNHGDLYLAGHSAGAHIASLIALNPEYLQKAGGKVSWIKGVIGLAGPYDFLPITDERLTGIFGKVDHKLSQPINYVRPDCPPFLLITSEKDDIVYPRNTKQLARQLERFNNPVEVKVYPRIDHRDVVLALSFYFQEKAPILKDILKFVNME